MTKWPKIKEIVFTPEDIEKRKNSIGGSDANIIMSGNEDKIMQLWEFKTGRRQNDDLSGVLPVMMGHWTEDFNAQWYEKNTGDFVTSRNELFFQADYPWRTANLDGVCLNGVAIWEAKHVNQMSNLDDVIDRYLPQLYHNAEVYGVEKAVISIFKGTLDWQSFEIDLEKNFSRKVLEAEKNFWNCVQEDTPPFEVATPLPPLNIDDMREVDMSQNNKWASLSVDIVETLESAIKHESSKKEIKSLVEDDVKKAFGGGITVSRNKKGVLSIKIDKKETNE